MSIICCNNPEIYIDWLIELGHNYFMLYSLSYHWFIFLSSFKSACIAPACFEKLYLQFAKQFHFWFICTTIKVFTVLYVHISQVCLYIFWQHILITFNFKRVRGQHRISLHLYFLNKCFVFLQNLGQEVWVNFLFLCICISWTFVLYFFKPWTGNVGQLCISLHGSLLGRAQCHTYAGI